MLRLKAVWLSDNHGVVDFHSFTKWEITAILLGNDHVSFTVAFYKIWQITYVNMLFMF